MEFSTLCNGDRETIAKLVEALHDAIDANDNEFSFMNWSVNAMCMLGVQLGINRGAILNAKALDIDLNDIISY